MKTIIVTPTVTAGAYTAGDAVGGKMEFSGVADRGWVVDATIVTKADIAPSLYLVLFSEDFTETADNAAFSVSDGDAENIVGQLSVAGNFVDVGGARFMTLSADNSTAVKIPYELTESTKRGRLFGQLYTDATPTFGATTDLIVKLTVVGENEAV